tara:strand:- start:2839 stop:3297 length:459 start_codon:yes stop_codon:yes gene_type:complete
MGMNTKTAFLLGPLASPLLVLFFVLFISIATGFQDGILGFLQSTAILFSASFLYSYGFTLLFGLPIYLWFMHIGLVSWFGFNLGAVFSTALVAGIMLTFGQAFSGTTYLLPILFFALCNANLMWFILKIQLTSQSIGHKNANRIFVSDALRR